MLFYMQLFWHYIRSQLSLRFVNGRSGIVRVKLVLDQHGRRIHERHCGSLFDFNRFLLVYFQNLLDLTNCFDRMFSSHSDEKPVVVDLVHKCYLLRRQNSNLWVGRSYKFGPLTG